MIELRATKDVPSGLFWAAPRDNDSDFTPEDPLALDYLGQQVGLWLFPGFTTRTSRAQYYAVVLYGLQLAEKAIQHFGYPGDDQTRTRLFERWERFWALATMEYRSGQLSRGDEDAMRGVRGAERAWCKGGMPLPIDFPLISRQSELGGLGAYLSSLRENGLVFSGSLRVTPAARDILDAFWSEKGERDMRGLYEDFAMVALDSDNKYIPRSMGRLTLAGLGDRSRLSCLVHRGRSEQQSRIWNALFTSRRDGSTLPLSEALIAAHKASLNDTKGFLVGALSDRWHQLSVDNKEKVNIALQFGQVSCLLLNRFNWAYRYVEEHGWVAEFASTAEAAFPGHQGLDLRQACEKLIETPGVGRFGNLPFHGSDFLALLRRLASSPPANSLEYLLAFHQAVQRSRRGGGSWLRSEDGKLVLQVTRYAGHRAEVAFPTFKLDSVRQLLSDLGKLE